MEGLANFLQTFGNLSLEFFWFPVIVWTVIAVPVILILRQTKSIPPVYQYHSRFALLLALPLGIIGSYVVGIIGQTSEAAIASTKFIVLQNPIAISESTEGTSQAISYSDPVILAGILGTVVLLGILFFLIRIILNAYSLKQIGNELNFIPISQIHDLDISSSVNNISKRTCVAFSDDTNIPFTYGWFNTKIVIPGDLKDHPNKCSMAIQHELMHVKHGDFLLNGILTFIKALFWFHPLTYYLHNTGQVYREITCDCEVLAANQFSRKKYASLLVQLAEKDYRNSRLAMSMAVNPSTLKKRIKIMSEHSINATKFRSSFLLTLVTTGLLVVTISCSDISDNGITNSEFEEAQTQMNADIDVDERPLYVINGEKVTETDRANKLSHIKSKYIKNINVLKGQQAKDRYGEAGANGVIELEFIDGISEDTVFTDLKAPPPPAQSEAGNVMSDNNTDNPPSPPSEDDFFVAVEDMPELKGGMASLMSEIEYPEMARKAGIEGKVIVQFIVNEQGQVEDPQVIRGIGGGCDEEAIRVVKQAEFEPGLQKGEPVPVQFALPVTFRLAGNNSDSEEQSSNMPDLKNNLDEITVTGYLEI